MTNLVSPRYIRSVTVTNNSDFDYTLIITYTKNDETVNEYNKICKNTDNQKFEYSYTINGTTYVYPITNVSLITDTNCGVQSVVYETSSEKIDSVKILEILVTVTNEVITNLN